MGMQIAEAAFRRASKVDEFIALLDEHLRERPDDFHDFTWRPHPVSETNVVIEGPQEAASAWEGIDRVIDELGGEKVAPR